MAKKKKVTRLTYTLTVSFDIDPMTPSNLDYVSGGMNMGIGALLDQFAIPEVESLDDLKEALAEKGFQPVLDAGEISITKAEAKVDIESPSS